MTLCPVALVIGCSKCPVFSICPLKTIIGDYKPGETAPISPPKNNAKGSAR